MTLIVDAAPMAPDRAEIDYLLAKRLGRAARRLFLKDLAAGRFAVTCLESAGYRAIADLDERYADLDSGLADFSIVVLAHRLGTDRIRHLTSGTFARSDRSVAGFSLLPKDE